MKSDSRVNGLFSKTVNLITVELIRQISQEARAKIVVFTKRYFRSLVLHVVCTPRNKGISKMSKVHIKI